MFDALESPAPQPQRPDPLPVQDLRVYELNGGHTLRKHVNTPPGDELRRIRKEGVAAAGSFLSLGVAQRSVKDAINARRKAVLAWLNGPDRRAPFAFRVDLGYITGRSLTWDDVRRGMSVPRQVTGVGVVLRRNATLPGGFTVVTAYPTQAPQPRPQQRQNWRTA